MNKTFKEVLIIIGISIVLGLTYNFFSDKPIPLFQQKKSNLFVSDSVLFGGLQKSDTVLPKENTLVIKDSVKKIKKDSINIKKDSIKSVISDDGILAISYKQVVKLLGRNDVVFIDARNPENYLKAHIGKAINIFPYEPNDAHIGKIASLSRYKTYVVYCDGGTCDLSHEVIKIMIDFGFKRIFLFSGGWEEWMKYHQL
ncbi:MAG: rhodanese-like domain-containing protein [Ignavibacteriae bacterium]|nr:rhodanese-like domain-containing protein [Ignavibacteriota bacterium]